MKDGSNYGSKVRANSLPTVTGHQVQQQSFVLCKKVKGSELIDNWKPGTLRDIHEFEARSLVVSIEINGSRKYLFTSSRSNKELREKVCDSLSLMVFTVLHHRLVDLQCLLFLLLTSFCWIGLSIVTCGQSATDTIPFWIRIRLFVSNITLEGR